MNRLNSLPNEIINDIYRVVFKECLLELRTRKDKFRVNLEILEVSECFGDEEDREQTDYLILPTYMDFEDSFIPPYFCYQDWRLLTKGA